VPAELDALDELGAVRGPPASDGRAVFAEDPAAEVEGVLARVAGHQD
jgi:hypothetical protein